jgi:hypothetical protein
MKEGGRQSLAGRWKWHVPPIRLLNFNGLHGVIFQKIKLLITTAVSTWNPTQHFLYFVCFIDLDVYLLQIWTSLQADIKRCKTNHATCIMCETNLLELPSHSSYRKVRIFQVHSLILGAEPFLRSRQLCSYSRTSQHFMEPEVSLSRSQEPSTGPYPEPDGSNPYQPVLSL